jgi:hypothetical protein
MCDNIDVNLSKEVAKIVQERLESVVVSISEREHKISTEEGVIGLIGGSTPLQLDLKKVPAQALEPVACLYGLLILAVLSENDEIKNYAIAALEKYSKLPQCDIGPIAIPSSNPYNPYLGTSQSPGIIEPLSSTSVDAYVDYVVAMKGKATTLFKGFHKTVDTQPWFIGSENSKARLRYTKAKEFMKFFDLDKNPRTTEWYDTSLWTNGGRASMGISDSQDDAFKQDIIKLTEPFQPTLKRELKTRLDTILKGIGSAISIQTQTTGSTYGSTNRPQAGGDGSRALGVGGLLMQEMGINLRIKCANDDAYKKKRILSTSLFEINPAYVTMPLRQGPGSSKDGSYDPLSKFFPKVVVGGAKEAPATALIPRITNERGLHAYVGILVEAILMIVSVMPDEWAVRIYVDDSVSSGELPKVMNALVSNFPEVAGRLQIVHVSIHQLKNANGLHGGHLPTIFRYLHWWDPDITHAVTIDSDNLPSPLFLQHIMYWADHNEAQFMGVRPYDNLEEWETELGVDMSYGEGKRHSHPYSRASWYGSRQCVPQVIAWCYGYKKPLKHIMNPAVWVNMLDFLLRGHNSYKDRPFVKQHDAPYQGCDFNPHLGSSPLQYTCDEQAPANVLLPLIYINSKMRDYSTPLHIDRGGKPVKPDMFVVPTSWGLTTRYYDDAKNQVQLGESMYVQDMYETVFEHASNEVKEEFEKYKIIPVIMNTDSTPKKLKHEADKSAMSSVMQREASDSVKFDITNKIHHQWIMAPLREWDPNYLVFLRNDNQMHVFTIMFLVLWELMAELGVETFNNRLFNGRRAFESIMELPWAYYAYYPGGDYLRMKWIEVCRDVQIIKNNIISKIPNAPK